jgi:hypothetical protein
MHKLFSSSYDASIYLQQPDQNTGRDELLEVGKLYYSSVKDIARSLVKFNINPISSSLHDNNVTGSWKCFLNLKTVAAEEIPLEYTLYANAVSQSWTMGTGTKFDNVTTDGISWKYRNGLDKWQDNTIGGTATYIAGTTGSANAEGGTWYTASEASQSFNYESSDLRMDVTGIVNLWISGTLPNNGFIIHHSLDNEYNNSLDYGMIKFFSKETSTIYEPKLELVWNDVSYVTTGLSKVTGSLYDNDYKVVLTNFKTKYPKDSVVKVRLKGRDMYPLKSFGSSFAYDQVKHLPTGSTYYQLEDYITKEVIVPFGEYSKVSCDTSGNYFKMDLSTLPISRNYLVKIKVVEDGISTIIDDKFMFEIVE